MDPRRLTPIAAAFYPAVVFSAWAVVSLVSPASPPRVESSSPALSAAHLASSLAANAELLATPGMTAIGYAAAGKAELPTADEFLARPAAEAPNPLNQPQPIVVAALTDPSQLLPEEKPAIGAEGTRIPASRLEIVDECLVAEACINQYLWALYQRTPKEDTTKETEKRKVTIKRSGKLVTVTRNFTKLVDNDFTWKDPHAAERAGMSMSDYVIGGMDKSFKLKLFYMLQAAENAGLQPGITSAFRDDYRQSIASGLKAASNRSYHGGSLRGGYGRGLAADIVSVNGKNRAQRWASTEALWKWVDANGKQYGIGRPYLAFDPPHVGPIDGPEYASRRGGTKAAAADVKKRQKHAAKAKPGAAKRQLAARSPSGKSSSRLAQAR